MSIKLWVTITAVSFLSGICLFAFQKKREDDESESTEQLSSIEDTFSEDESNWFVDSINSIQYEDGVISRESMLFILHEVREGML